MGEIKQKRTSQHSKLIIINYLFDFFNYKVITGLIIKSRTSENRFLVGYKRTKVTNPTGQSFLKISLRKLNIVLILEYDEVK